MIRLLLCLIAIPALILLDQWSKWAVWEYLKFGPVAPMPFDVWLTSFPLPPMLYDGVALTKFLNLVTVWNQGVSFGMFAADDMHRAYLLVGAAGLMAACLAVWLVRAQTKLVTVALTMVIAGALGNIIDRIRFGAVADFIDLHIGGWHYPAFNVADSLIVMGVVLLTIDTLFLASKREKQADSAAPPNDPSNKAVPDASSPTL